MSAVKASGRMRLLVLAVGVVAAWLIVIVAGCLGGLIVVGFLNVVFP